MKWVISSCLLLVCAIALAAEPPVKKSRNGICHPQGGTYYSRTKHYTPTTPCRPASTAADGRPNADGVRPAPAAYLGCRVKKAMALFFWQSKWMLCSPLISRVSLTAMGWPAAVSWPLNR